MDGKDNELEGFRGTTRTVTAEWSDEDKTLTFSSFMEFERGGQSFDITATEVWCLKKKKVLSIESVVETPRGSRESTLVYEKVE